MTKAELIKALEPHAETFVRTHQGEHWRGVWLGTDNAVSGKARRQRRQQLKPLAEDYLRTHKPVGMPLWMFFVPWGWLISALVTRILRWLESPREFTVGMSINDEPGGDDA